MTSEQLSDFLDGKVSVQEQIQWESHLQNCSLCQQELASLRQMVTMLHALPPPVLPRSFVLPLTTAKPSASPIAPTPIPIETARRRPWKSYVRVAMRTVSTIAAVIGVVFLLSTVIQGGMSATSTGVSSSALKNHTSTSGSTEPSAQGPTSTGIVTSQAKVTPTFAAGATPTLPSLARIQPTQSVEPPSNSQPNTPFSWFDIFNLGAPVARLGVGMLLIIFGLMGVVLFKRQPHLRGE